MPLPLWLTHLRRCPSEALCHIHQSRILEGLAVAQRAVGLHRAPDRSEEGQGLLPEQKRIDLNLVDCRANLGAAGHQLQVVLFAIIGHSDRADLASGLRLLELQVCRHMLGRHRPVDAVQVEVVCAEVGERALQLRLHCLGPFGDGGRPDLGGEEDLVARNTAPRNALAHRLLVRVELSAVDKAVT
eukprot:scaffold566_cov115-Isochrysis_galbana.AAC.2